MSKIYVAKYFGTVVGTGKSKEEASSGYGYLEPNITIEEMEATDYILREIPKEFKGCLSYMAYERGHSSGEQEVEMILQDLVHDLKPAIEKFKTRIISESKTPTQAPQSLSISVSHTVSPK